MKTHLLRLLFACVFLVNAVPSIQAEQPRMHEAIDSLNRAKSGTEPVKDLKKAKLALSHGKRNKAFYRKEAIPLVDKAIAAAEAGNRTEANKFIAEAITKVERAVKAGN